MKRKWHIFTNPKQKLDKMICICALSSSGGPFKTKHREYTEKETHDEAHNKDEKERGGRGKEVNREKIKLI